MPHVVYAPKLLSEIRLETLDVSPWVPAGVTLTYASGTAVVYSGVDPAPSVLVSVGVVSGTLTVNVLLSSAALLGVIYNISITVTLSNSSTVVLSGFLAVIPDSI